MTDINNVSKRTMTTRWIDHVRSNYGLWGRTPEEAASKFGPMAPPNAVITALGYALDEVEHLRAENATLRNERGADTGIDCCLCNIRIYGTMIGAGDGTGQKFAHPECYYRMRVVELESAAEQEVGVSERIVTPEWIAIQRKYYEAGVFTPVTMRSLANILHALDEVERLQATVERVRSLHQPIARGILKCVVCKDYAGNHLDLPCPTLRALEGTV